MLRRRPRTSSNPMAFASAAAVSRPATLILRASSRPIIPAEIMIPNPPIWISSMMTTWPNPVQCVAVSTTVSPVTQTADVAVNSASKKFVTDPERDEIGSMSNPVPSSVATAKAATTLRAGRTRRTRARAELSLPSVMIGLYARGTRADALPFRPRRMSRAELRGPPTLPPPHFDTRLRGYSVTVARRGSPTLPPPHFDTRLRGYSVTVAGGGRLRSRRHTSIRGSAATQ